MGRGLFHDDWAAGTDRRRMRMPHALPVNEGLVRRWVDVHPRWKDTDFEEMVGMVNGFLKISMEMAKGKSFRLLDRASRLVKIVFLDTC